MLGHSYIARAGNYAQDRPVGRNLGFRKVDMYWRGIGGLRWKEVLPAAWRIGQDARGPVILVIHAGGNDLCFMKMAELITIMRADLERLPAVFPKVVLVWSEMVPRVVWRGARNAAAIERTRKTVNVRLSRFVRDRLGVVVRHYQLEGDN